MSKTENFLIKDDIVRRYITNFVKLHYLKRDSQFYFLLAISLVCPIILFFLVSKTAYGFELIVRINIAIISTLAFHRIKSVLNHDSYKFYTDPYFFLREDDSKFNKVLREIFIGIKRYPIMFEIIVWCCLLNFVLVTTFLK